MNNTFRGRSEEEVRNHILKVMVQQNLTLEELFLRAAKDHAPLLKQDKVLRKSRRYEEGGAAPVFVKDFLLALLEKSQGRKTLSALKLQGAAAP